MLKRLVASALLASMLACTTLRPVADYQAYVQTSRPSQLLVTPRNAQPVLVDGPRFVHDTLVGFVRGHYREFSPAEVGRVQVRQPAKTRTALLVGAAVAVSAALFAMLASGGPSTYIPGPEDPPATIHP